MFCFWEKKAYAIFSSSYHLWHIDIKHIDINNEISCCSICHTLHGSVRSLDTLHRVIHCILYQYIIKVNSQTNINLIYVYQHYKLARACVLSFKCQCMTRSLRFLTNKMSYTFIQILKLFRACVFSSDVKVYNLKFYFDIC